MSLAIEVFYHNGTWIDREDDSEQGYTMLDPGWYWWACQPGCLPDSDPHGPFQSEELAQADANEGIE